MDDRIIPFDKLCTLHGDTDWPVRTVEPCRWCLHRFDTFPFGIPCMFRQKEHVLVLEGCFCHPACARAYNNDREKGTANARRIDNLILRMASTPPYNMDVKRIGIAMPREMLRLFGGPLPIEEFRKHRTPCVRVACRLGFPSIQRAMIMVERNHVPLECTASSTAVGQARAAARRKNALLHGRLPSLALSANILTTTASTTTNSTTSNGAERNKSREDTASESRTAVARGDRNAKQSVIRAGRVQLPSAKPSVRISSVRPIMPANSLHSTENLATTTADIGANKSLRLARPVGVVESLMRAAGRSTTTPPLSPPQPTTTTTTSHPLSASSTFAYGSSTSSSLQGDVRNNNAIASNQKIGQDTESLTKTTTLKRSAKFVTGSDAKTPNFDRVGHKKRKTREGHL